MAHDVFISHSSKDKSIADAVCATLERNRIRCWIAPRDIQPAQDFARAIIDAIHAARVLVLVFSGASNTSEHVIREVNRAIAAGLPVLPLRVEDVTPTDSLDYYLAGKHWLDALTPPLEAHLARLSEAVSRLLTPTDVAPRPLPNSQPVAPSVAPIPAPLESAAPLQRGRPSPELVRSTPPGGAAATLEEVDGIFSRVEDGLRAYARQADHIGEKLRRVGCVVVPDDAPGEPATFTPVEIEEMAEIAHGQWTAERLLAGWIWGETKDPARRRSPYLVAWKDLPEEIREFDRLTVREIPDLLASVGLAVRRATPLPSHV